MKRIIAKFEPIINKFISKLGYKFINLDSYYKKSNYYRKVMIERAKFKKEEKIDSIVFSKDRAIQLHAFLISYIQQVQDYGTIFILYKTSDERHKKSYEELKTIFNSEKFVFIEETEFRKQLIAILSQSKANTIGLYVDDMIFLQTVNYTDILKVNTFENVVTLSRGKEMDYSVVLQRKIDLPTFANLENEMLSFSWNQYNYLSDWTYPLGVSGYFYGRDELLIMFSDQSYKAPNSLESSMQFYKEFFINRKGVCYSSISCCCIHANIVQTECINPTLGVFSIEDLLNKWNEGMKIDVSQFYAKTGNEAQFQRYTFTKREC